MVHYCQKKLKNFNWTKNFAKNAKFSSFKKFGKHTGFEHV